ncbi:MAG: metallophosphoesterase family protein [Thermodesulfobacteriota bacterium]|nr:metallophosphoesterase family protein [Thermodesulfobacteriota bacterium]
MFLFPSLEIGIKLLNFIVMPFKTRRKVFSYSLVVFTILLIIYSSLIEPNIISVNSVSIANDKLFALFNDKKLVQISDLHITSIGHLENKLVKKLNSINPDILFITGDFLVNGKDEDACIAVLRQIKKPTYGIWAVLGNTDKYLRDKPNENIDRFVERLKQLGVMILRDSCEQLVMSENHEKLLIIGVEESQLSRSKLHWLLKNVPDNSAVILMTHYPDIFEQHPDTLIINLGEEEDEVIKGWVWQDNAFFEDFDGIIRFERDGIHTLRVQRREAGVLIHQICLVSENDNKSLSEKERETAIDTHPEIYKKINPHFRGMIIIKAEDIPISSIFGSWQKVSDTSIDNDTVIKDMEGFNIQNEFPLMKPDNFFEVSFFALGNVDYHVWVRMRAADERVSGDSIYIQFSDSIDKEGKPIYRIAEMGSRNNLRKVDLILSGHTHGGQVRFPIIGALDVLPNHSLKYDRGVFKNKKTVLYVNRGIGTTILPIRLLCSPEITLFKFSQEEN